MEYLKPIETLEKTNQTLKISLWALLLTLAMVVIFLPSEIRKSNPVVIETKDGMILADISPWGSSLQRFEQFTNAYLAARFLWKPETLDQKKTDLKTMTTEQVFTKLKTSVSALESLAINQKARSFYVLEDLNIANKNQKIEILATRVLRIKNASFATPLHIFLSYQEVPITKENPYGLEVSGLNESEIPLEDK